MKWYIPVGIGIGIIVILVIVIVWVQSNAVIGPGIDPSKTEARKIALSSDCVKEGTVENLEVYNQQTKTVWFKLIPNIPKEGCNPACVVNLQNKSAEINWRCTGLLPQ